MTDAVAKVVEEIHQSLIVVKILRLVNLLAESNLETHAAALLRVLRNGAEEAEATKTRMRVMETEMI